MNCVRKILLPYVIVCPLVLAGCFGDNDNDNDAGDDPMGMENTAPTASDAMFTTQADTPLEDSLAGDDADGDTLTFALESEPERGMVTVNDDGSFRYLPDATLTGTDQFTFTVSDGMDSSAPATVDIAIEALQASFSSYSREVFGQSETDEPLPINGRIFDQDVTDEAAYDDLLMSPQLSLGQP